MSDYHFHSYSSSLPPYRKIEVAVAVAIEKDQEEERKESDHHSKNPQQPESIESVFWSCSGCTSETLCLVEHMYPNEVVAEAEMIMPENAKWKVCR